MIRTVVLTVDPENPSSEAISQAACTINQGGLVAFPTETVYGLAADALNPEALRRVYEVKGRPENKPLPVQVSSKADIEALVTEMPVEAAILIEKYFPGPLTIVLHASERVSDIVTAGTGKVGIRMPDHRVPLALIAAAGTPIVAPSANPSGKPSPVSAQEVYDYLSGKIDMILDAGTSQLKIASTVIDMTVSPFVVIREGAISEQQLRSAVDQIRE